MAQEIEAAPSLRRLRRRTADAATDILDRFETIDRASLDDRYANRDAIKALEHLFGCDYHFVDDLAEQTQGSEKIYLNPVDDAAELAEAMWPIDFAIAVRKDDHIQLCRVVTVEASELRGKIRIVGRKNVILYCGWLYDNGQWSCDRVYASLLNQRWIDASRGIVTTTRRSGAGQLVAGNLSNLRHAAELHRTIAMHCSGALTERYSWHAALGSIPGGPRLLLPTGPAGCLALFRNRQREEGRSRRAALRHWVANHYRQDDAAGLIYVRDHLRGATEFQWQDLDCEILVSAFDLEKNAFFREQAAQWRAARVHNRVRVRLKRHHVR